MKDFIVQRYKKGALRPGEMPEPALRDDTEMVPTKRNAAIVFGATAYSRLAATELEGADWTPRHSRRWARPRLKIAAVADGGQATPFSVSLKGFQGAYDRTVEGRVFGR
jgi:hypothetical protein